MIGDLTWVLAIAIGVSGPSLPRERTSFNEGWRFEKGNPADATGSLAYEKIEPWLLDPNKAGAPDGGPFAQTAFDDRSWQKVRLPHDWGIEGPFRQEYPGETGKLPWWGVGWYRKQFASPPSDTGRQVYLDLDGAMSYSSVWLNGRFVGGRPYGYSSFRVDLTSALKAGQQNVLAVRLDNPQESSRWYPGGGIYRNVWLVKTAPVSIAHWGVTLTTPSVSAQEATVEAKIVVENRSASQDAVSVETEIFDGKRRIARMSPTEGKADPAGDVKLLEKASLSNPRLWSTTTPYLYRAVTTVRSGGKVVDSVETTFGIRSIRFDPKQGFLLNGQRTFLKGVCLHHDLGALGTAFNMRAAERQFEILKSMGCNALRTSHNPPAPEVLDLCDRMGILVMDEFSDTWTHAKKRNGYAKLFGDWHETDLRGMIRRDRNHPCVVMWSTGNEIAEQGAPGGHDISRMLTAIVHDEDPTRPATSGNDHLEAGYNGYQKTIDVFGYNYKPAYYHRFVEANPDIPLFGSETASTISTRGEYFFPVTSDRNQSFVDFQVNSYDLTYPGWATTPDMEFRGQDENPSVYGEFVWTGFDYLGEPTPFGGDSRSMPNFTQSRLRAKAAKELEANGRVSVPSRSSYFGIVDLAGFPKDRFYLYQARWRPELKMAHLLPHWNWPDRIGQVTPVHLYTSGDEAELFLNGKSLGRKKRGPLEYRLRWDDVKYEPGELKAVVYKNGKPWAQDVVRTTGFPNGLTLKPDRNTILADGQDLAYFTVAVVDEKGEVVPQSNNRIEFEISGPGEIVATDNGDPTNLEPFQAKNKQAFNGLCLVIVRSKAGEKGRIRLTAGSHGIEEAEATIRTR